RCGLELPDATPERCYSPIGPSPSFELQYCNQSQHAAILATKSNPLHFAVTHQPLAVRYFKQYYKMVLEDDLRTEYRFEEDKNSGSSFGLNVGVQPAGFELSRDYGNISGPSVLTGPTTHEPRSFAVQAQKFPSTHESQQLRPDTVVAIASDNDVQSVCGKARWTFIYAEWTIQKAMQLLQSCADCMEKEDQVLTLNFESPHWEELSDEGSEQDTRQLIDAANTGPMPTLSNDFTRSTEDEHAITPAPKPPLAPIGGEQSLDVQELSGSGVRLEIDMVYKQDLARIHHVGHSAIGFSLSLDFNGSERLNITKLYVKVTLTLLDNGRGTIGSNPADATIAYPRDFEERFGKYRTAWRSPGHSYDNEATWSLTGEHLTAPSGFSLVVRGDVDFAITVEARAFSSTGGVLYFNKLAAERTLSFSSYPCWSKDWSEPDNISSWFATKDVASHWV
ncbi:hypothetical protein BT69DRAFT_1360911, partial [Atractiella rhizophila]